MATNSYFPLKIAGHFYPIFVVLAMLACSLSAYQLNSPGFGNFAEPPKAENGQLKIAGMNVKMRSITDHPNNMSKFPKYQWKYRIVPLVSLIEKDTPDVLGLSETTFTQMQLRMTSYSIFK